MSDVEIITILAEFDERRIGKELIPRYIDSRDALALIFGKLTGEQWGALFDVLKPQMDRQVLSIHWLLTCPPRVLAEAVAMVVKEGK